MNFDPSKIVSQNQEGSQQAPLVPTNPISPEKLEVNQISRKLWTPSDFEAIDKLMNKYSNYEESNTSK